MRRARPRASARPDAPSSTCATSKVHFPTDDGLVKSVDGLSFQLEKGKTLGIVGESGSGKSVTSLGIMGLHTAGQYGSARRRSPARSGSTARSCSSADPDEVRKLRGREMAMIFQDPLSALHPYYTIGKQIVEAYRVHHDVDKKTARKRARSRCSTGSASRSRTSGSTATRTSSPAACASAR